MPSENSIKALKPFKEGDDPRRNVTGQNRSSISSILRDLGDSKSLSFNIVITKTDGTKRTMKGKVSGRGKNGTINQIVATQLLAMAVKGNLKAIKELLDRTEGKPKQIIDLDIKEKERKTTDDLFPPENEIDEAIRKTFDE